VNIVRPVHRFQTAGKVLFFVLREDKDGNQGPSEIAVAEVRGSRCFEPASEEESTNTSKSCGSQSPETVVLRPLKLSVLARPEHDVGWAH
jgi:hypothetical protein